MYDVVVLSLADPAEAGTVRVPVRTCTDALAGAGASARAVTATSDEQIDEVLADLDAPARPDGLAWPGDGGGTRLVVAVAADSQLRAVVRRMVRRWAPPPSRRLPELPAGRTVPDLPPVGVLPLDGGAARDLAGQLGLPRDPAQVAAATLAGRVRRLDLLRTDAGSVTLDGALLGGTDHGGRAVPWRGRVEVDDAVLAGGDEPLLTALVANAGGYAALDGLPLVADPAPDSGAVAVAVAVPVRQRWSRKVRVEVRRSRGRAAVVSPAGDGVGLLDDGVAGELARKRTWWVEPAAWAVYSPPGDDPAPI